MRELSRVIANEWTKLLYRRRFWVTGILALLTVALFSVITYHDHKNETSYNPVQQTRLAISGVKQQIAQLEQSTRVPSKTGHSSSGQSQPGQLSADQRRQQLQFLKQDLSQLRNQLHTLSQPSHVDWQAQQKATIAQLTATIKQLQSGVQSAATRNQIGQMQMQIKQTQYILDHHIQPRQNNVESAYQYITHFEDVAAHIFLPLLVVILVTDMISGEASDGTIKLLLVRPVSRTKILLGKWIVSLMGSVLMTVVFFAAIWLVAVAIAGPGGASDPVFTNVHYTFETELMPGTTQLETLAIPHLEHAVIVSQVTFFVTGIFYTALAMMVVATIGLFCSVLFRSAMASTAIAMGTVVIGFIVAMMAQRQSWVAWLFPTHLDLWQNWSGQLSVASYQNMTLTVGLIVLAVWTIVALVVSVWQFARRDVLNA